MPTHSHLLGVDVRGCAIGLSGVIFGLLVVDNAHSGAGACVLGVCITCWHAWSRGVSGVIFGLLVVDNAHGGAGACVLGVCISYQSAWSCGMSGRHRWAVYVLNFGSMALRLALGAQAHAPQAGAPLWAWWLHVPNDTIARTLTCCTRRVLLLRPAWRVAGQRSTFGLFTVPAHPYP